MPSLPRAASELTRPGSKTGHNRKSNKFLTYLNEKGGTGRPEDEPKPKIVF